MRNISLQYNLNNNHLLKTENMKKNIGSKPIYCEEGKDSEGIHKDLFGKTLEELFPAQEDS